MRYDKIVDCLLCLTIAGGLAVSTLAVIPEAKGLFQRIIALSGGPVGRTHPSSTQTYHLTGVAELLGKYNMYL